MKINNNLVEEIKSFDFFKESRSTNIPIILLESIDIAEKNINGIKWENYVLDRVGDFTEYLCIHERETYREWNSLVRDVNHRILPFVNKKLRMLVKKIKYIK